MSGTTNSPSMPVCVTSNSIVSPALRSAPHTVFKKLMNRRHMGYQPDPPIVGPATQLSSIEQTQEIDD
jgi:hypothetical protein